MKRVLFVCLGNICRSPAAEAIFRARADAGAFRFDSAGTSGWNIGDPPYPPMQQAAARRGYELGALRARRFTPADFAAFDMILAMDGDNLAQIEAQRPPGNLTPVERLLDDVANVAVRDVPDPYYTRDFEGALDLIEAAAAARLATWR